MSGFIRTLFYGLLLLLIIPTLLRQLNKQYTTLLTPHTKIGCVPIGTLKHDHVILKSLKEFFERSDIKAVVLKINSPGGAAGTSQLLFQEIIALKKQYMKPVVALAENVCASGGYYVAAATDFIVAPPSACIGSIGAYIAYPNISKLLEQVKVQYNVAAAGNYKMLLNPYTEHSSEQDELIKQLAQDTYEQFVQDVVAQRSQLSMTELKTWADGRIFTGRQAVQLGLIDAIGSQHTVEEYIKSRIPIEGKIEWEVAHKTPAFMELLGIENLSITSFIAHYLTEHHDAPTVNSTLAPQV